MPTSKQCDSVTKIDQTNVDQSRIKVVCLESVESVEFVSQSTDGICRRLQVSFATTVPTSMAAAGTAWIAFFDVTMLSPGRSYRLCHGLRNHLAAHPAQAEGSEPIDTQFVHREHKILLEFSSSSLVLFLRFVKFVFGYRSAE